MKNRKTIVALLLVAIVGLVGLTIAYFSNSQTINNLFSTKEYGTTYIEEFVSPSNWLPGDTTDKVVTATNSGQVDEAVRISLSEEWIPNDSNATLTGWIHADGTKSNHTTEEELATDVRAAVINLANSSDWTKVGNYYYYNYKLAPNETTSSFIESVTFNPLTKLGDTCTESESNGTKTITCNSSGEDYDNATYKLTLTIETVQYNKYQTAWNLNNNVTIASEKPLIVYGLNVNRKTKTYVTGDIHQMYEFEHPATEQTPALTDYRYIGNDPYNYVYFNCDSLDNQNSNTCEVWRIIGVFDVERPDQNDNTQTITEKRMKLVRGDILNESQYDLNSANEWTQSNLKLVLNNEYYNSLKDNTKNLISSAKYYLGSTTNHYPEKIGYGSTEEIYSWERGNLVYDSSPIYWIGNIALMYSSDHYYTYSKGVNNICFNEPHYCGSPQTSWIYNSDIYNNSQSSTWFITSYPNNNDISFFMNKPGQLSYYFNDGYYDPIGVRPVLYLSSSVSVTEGTGEQNNPYKLGL